MIPFVWLNTQDCQVYSWLQVLHLFMVCQPITINSTHKIHYKTSKIKWWTFFLLIKKKLKTLPAKFQKFNKILLWLKSHYDEFLKMFLRNFKKYILILHRISRLNAPASVGYKCWRKTCKMNTKSERGPEWTDQTPSDG